MGGGARTPLRLWAAPAAGRGSDGGWVCGGLGESLEGMWGLEGECCPASPPLGPGPEAWSGPLRGLFGPSDCWRLAGPGFGDPHPDAHWVVPMAFAGEPVPCVHSSPCPVPPLGSRPSLHLGSWPPWGEPGGATRAPSPQSTSPLCKAPALHRRDLIQPPGPWGRGRDGEGAPGLPQQRPSSIPSS